MGMTKEQREIINKITVKQVKELYKKPLTLKEIASKLKVSVDFVMKFAKRNGIERDKNITIKLREQTNLKKYGYVNPLQNKKIKDKAKKTCLEKYGVDNPAKSKEVLERARHTNLRKYGVEWTCKAKEIRDRINNTMVRKYGYNTPAKNDKIKEKMFNTNLKRYGVKSTLELNKVKDKIKQTNIKKYGVENPLGNKEIRDKAKQTLKERYGVEYITQNKDIRKKIEETSLKRFGKKSYLQTEDHKRKTKETNLRKWGTEWASQNEEIKQRVKNTNLEKYGKSVYTQTEDYRNKTEQTCQQKYGVNYPCQRPEARFKGNNSQPNKLFAELLDKYKIKYKREFNLKRYIYDFKINDKLIEINPSFTHNSTDKFKRTQPKSKTYHQDKSDIAEQNGYHCIHIWDWDNEEKIVKLFLTKKAKIYARDCKIKEITNEETDKFLGEYHLQGICRNNKINIGLYYKNELVELMVFGTQKYNKNYEYEILRLCSSKIVIGGGEKLFKYFIKTYQPKSIISYCDNSKFSDDVYQKLGFELTRTQPSRHWYNIATKRHITDNELRRLGFDKLLGKEYGTFGKGTSNEQLMKQHGFVEVYDAGQQIYIYKKK